MNNQTNESGFSDLSKTIQYTFQKKEFLHEALRHSSFVNEQPRKKIRDNERFEFLGDAVLNLVVGDLLMQYHPSLNEGDLSRIRANLVNETALAAISRSIDLGAYLLLGKGEIQTNGRDKNSILADALEALIAAIYLDGGFDNAYLFIKSRFSHLIKSVPNAEEVLDYKSKLQELVQVSHREVPRYTVIGENGPDHDKTFRVEMKVNGIKAQGKGKSKKLAEQDAAKSGLEILKSKKSHPEDRT